MYKIVCFIGHRKIVITFDLEKKLTEYIEYLIVNENVKVFLFGSRSEFDNLCYDIVSKLKEKYPYIKRIYFRSCYEKISDSYEKFLIEIYEGAIYLKECKGSGKSTYIKRNQTMIDNSDFCIFYYNQDYLPPKRKCRKKDLFDYQPKSGTAIAYKYAKQKKKTIKNFYSE